MMPLVLEVQKSLISRKSPRENQADLERCLAAADRAAAEHNRVLTLHGAPSRFHSDVTITEPEGLGCLFVWLQILSELITQKSPDENAYDIAGILQAAVHALAEQNLVLLEHHPWLPDLYDADIKYLQDPNAWRVQTLKTIPTIKEQGGSDCKNLVGWRLAHKWRNELRPPPLGFGNRMSRCKIYWRFLPKEHLLTVLPPNLRAEIIARMAESGPIPPGRLFHAEMRSPDSPKGYTTPDGEVEDMSRYLGM